MFRPNGLTFATIAVVLSGCAGSSGGHRLVDQTANPGQLAAYSNLAVAVKQTPNQPLSDADKKRIGQGILDAVENEAPGRLRPVAPIDAANTNALLATITIKRYDEGNAFARAMLAGLGQIHIDADLVLSDMLSGAKLAQYEVDKTFAWGGLLGASTDIQDVEEGFCKGVAEAILEKPE